MATGVALPLPIWQIFDNNGNPNIGGSVLFTVGGIPTAVYQDIGLTIPLPATGINGGIPLNSRGEISDSSGNSRQLFLTPNTVYVATIFDAAGNQIAQANYVNGVQLVLTATNVGAVLYPQTAAELAAGVMPVNIWIAPGNVLRYGTNTTPGTTDMTVAFQNALNSNGAVYVPDGTYLLSVGSINMPIGTQITFSKSATITVTAIAANYIFNFAGNNTISGGVFSSTNDYPVIAQAVGAINNVNVIEVISNGPRLFFGNTSITGTAAAIYAGAADGNSPSGIAVEHCTATHVTLVASIACVFFQYCRNSHTQGNEYSGCFWGETFWGGDAAIDGALITATRKCRNIRLEGGNYVGNGTGLAAFWGSMGQNITINGNTAFGGLDVGIDFEGCINATATGNTVQDFVNGQLATFFQNRGIAFNGNTALVTNTAYPLFRVNNSSGSVANNLDISVVGNTFTCTSGSVSSVINGGPCRTFLFSNNTLTNVKFNFSNTSNFNRIEIKDNVLVFEVSPGAAFNAIDTVGGVLGTAGTTGNVSIDGNDISALFTPAAGSIGIRVNTYDTNGSSSVQIDNNRIAEFPVDITTVESGTNGGISGKYLIRRNRVDARVYTRTESGSLNSTVILEDNFDSTATPFPSAIPGAGRWDVAQKVWYAAPTASNPPGAICVTAGTPGTWKAMANLGA
jgi:hypothetical protein